MGELLDVGNIYFLEVLKDLVYISRWNFTWAKMPLWKCSSLSDIQLFATQWTVALQAPLSMEFFRQEY